MAISESSTGMPLDAATLMSTILEGILYGFSVLMFIGTIWIFTYKRRMRDARPTIVVATLLFLLSTVHMVICIIYIENGLVKYSDTFPGGPVAYFADLLQPMFVVKNAILVLQTLLGDGVVIYRCYVVWQSARIIILPIIMWCGVAVFGVCMVYSMSQPADNSTNFFLNATPQWITAFISFTMATNLLSSGLLAYRVWTIERKVSATRATKNNIPILRVFVDAAILYSAAVCSSLISFVCSSSGMYVMADLVIPIIPIAFYMVFIRIASSQNSQTYAQTVRGGITETERRNSRYPLQPSHTIRWHKQSSSTSLTDSPKV
ncbi:uncharacterized protein F5891DRAFT_726143 [Suillus fuscotomentosus]|uniref:Uncharacterized protein n=1 Tax=Suillus fuscotomentosus TaxID=1912939 RepID=A0AAD4HQD5_9AGAM|nr:uncharacterized protein F5891DRAFT_726143 [Suillus fuscotomentosus]KAG1905143.1 hypothetical protein F5891DRAFT_726143 [Suillus fuscotomentosus]